MAGAILKERLNTEYHYHQAQSYTALQSTQKRRILNHDAFHPTQTLSNKSYIIVLFQQVCLVLKKEKLVFCYNVVVSNFLPGEELVK